jgi:hypothetical protein
LARTAQRPPKRNGRTAMRYLKLAIIVLAYVLISPAFAQTCCPSGCARGRSVRDHRSAVDQMHSFRLRRGFSKAVRRVLSPHARAPKKRGARAPAKHSAYLCGPSSDSPALPIDGADQSTGRRGDRSMRERVDQKCTVPGLLFRGRCRQGRRQKDWPEMPWSSSCAG